MTGVVARTAANVAGGARTRLATVVHGLLLVAVVTIRGRSAASRWRRWRRSDVHRRPLARPSVFADLWAQGPARFVPFLVTVVAILLSDLLVGIAIGLAVAFAFILWDQITFPCYTIVSPPGAVLTRARLQEHVSFINKASLARLFEPAPGSRLELDGTPCRYVDRDVQELIANFRRAAPAAHRFPDRRPGAPAR